MELVTICEGIITQLTSITNSSAIDILTAKKSRVIEGVDGDSIDIEKVSVIDINNTKALNLIKSKDLV